MDNEIQEEQKRLIEELQTKLDTQSEQVQELLDFKESILSGTLSKQVIGDTDINISNGNRFTSGDTSLFGLSDPTVDQQFGFMSTGRDLSEVAGYDLTEVITWYDGISKLSAFYGRGGPILLTRDAVVRDGSLKIRSESINSFDVNDLIGKLITVSTDSGTYGFQIASNTGTSLTLAGSIGSGWIAPVGYGYGEFLSHNGSTYISKKSHTSAAATEPGVGASWQTVWALFVVGNETGTQIEILNTVYLGSGSSPWKRSYVETSSAGGVRFGPGSTGNGQNGLLYADGQTLKYRKPDGSITTLA